jgi:hypothetical protein
VQPNYTWSIQERTPIREKKKNTNSKILENLKIRKARTVESNHPPIKSFEQNNF